MAPFISSSTWFIVLLLLTSSHTFLFAVAEEYGVDASYPIHYGIDKTKYPMWAKQYEENMAGCYKYYSKRECDATERTRLQMNLDQPKSNHNYTEIGFKKVKVPESAWKPLIEFYHANKHKAVEEEWPRGYTYVNTWKAPSDMVSLENRAFRGGYDVKQEVWNGMRPIIEEWTGQKIEPTSMYGIRIYKSESILATHVDRLPLVSSCIINVDQDVDEPWFAEVYDHAGNAHNVSMDPGDAVLYESHTVLHGRPFPMKGRFYANIFIHFQPVGYANFNKAEQAGMKKGIPPLPPHKEGVDSHIHSSSAAAHHVSNDNLYTRTSGGHEQSNHDEEAIAFHLDAIDKEAAAEFEAAAEEATHNPHQHKLPNKVPRANAITAKNGARSYPQGASKFQGGPEGVRMKGANGKFAASTVAAFHDAAARGDTALMELFLRDTNDQTTLLDSVDENYWTALHEAVRAGELDSVTFLVDNGADIGAESVGGLTPLMIARDVLYTAHPVIQYLLSIGAPEHEVLGDEM